MAQSVTVRAKVIVETTTPNFQASLDTALTDLQADGFIIRDIQLGIGTTGQLGALATTLLYRALIALIVYEDYPR